MAVLVVGGAGYVGAHVAKQLWGAGHGVVVLDSLVHGHRDFACWGAFYYGDFGDEKLLEEIFTDYKVDAVMHFAAFSQVRESVADPAKYYKNNVLKTLTLLKTMLKHGIENFVFSSTAAVYGNPETIPIAEDHPKKPINPYGRTKLAVENMLEDFSNAYGLKYVSLRYFNAAGADSEADIGEDHNPESHLIPLILDAAIGRRGGIKVFGSDYHTQDGTCIRDYIHVSEIAEAHILALHYLREKGTSDVFNLGTGRGFSVREVIEAARRVTGKDIKTKETHRREGDPPVLVADPSRAIKLLNWKPKFGMDEIVESAWLWHLKRFGDYRGEN